MDKFLKLMKYQSNLFQVSYLIVDETLTDLEMKPDPFDDDIPPSELPYRKDCPSIYKKNRSILIRSHSFCCNFKQDVGLEVKSTQYKKLVPNVWRFTS